MGATQFSNIGVGKDLGEAFQRTVRRAQYEHGHGGYTGTIAEKSDAIEARLSAG